MAERETDRPQRYPEIPTARERRNGGWGGWRLVGVGVCKEARCLYSVQGKDALARAATQQGRPDTRLEARASGLALVFDVLYLDPEPPGPGGYWVGWWPCWKWLRPKGKTPPATWTTCFMENGANTKG